MNYELCKKLKDAGFPFDWGRKCPQCDVEGRHSDCPDPCPSLSELIAACGGEFLTLRKIGNVWEATGEPKAGNIDNQRTYAATPEEAVANLWLSLNEKLTPKP